jgi:putative peptide zinc metalloprotease protein
MFPELSYRILCQLGPGVSIRQAVGNAIGSGEPPQALLRSTTKLITEARRAGLLVFPGEKERPRKEKQSLVAAGSRFNPLFIKLTLFNPQRATKALDPLAGILYSKPALWLWIASVFSMLIFVSLHWHGYIGTFSLFNDFKWWTAVYGIMAASTIFHEFGHVLACHRFGVEVKEMGVLIYLFNPGAFADVSGASMLADVRKRLVISLGGLYVEGFLWTIATLLWSLSPSRSAVRGVAFAVSISLIMRIVFNLIPFLRLDGYWVLSDLLGIPNLHTKSFRYLFSFVPVMGKYVRLPRTLDRKESIVFSTYGLLSFSCLFIFLEVAARKFHAWVLHRSPDFGEVIFWCVVILISSFTVLNIWQHGRRAGVR